MERQRDTLHAVDGRTGQRDVLANSAHFSISWRHAAAAGAGARVSTRQQRQVPRSVGKRGGTNLAGGAARRKEKRSNTLLALKARVREGVWLAKSAHCSSS